jgi:ATP-binding cassette subfamily B protein
VAATTLAILGPLRQRWRSCLALLLAIWVGVAFNAYFPLTIRTLIDDAAARGDLGLFGRTVAILGLFFAVYGVVGIWRDRATASLVAWLLNELRRRMFEHLQRLPLTYFSGRQAGDILSHFSNDLGALEQPLRYSLPWSIHAASQIVVSLVILFLLNWRLALVSVAVLPLAMLGPKLFARRAAAASDDRRRREASLLGRTHEAIEGQTTVRLFGLRDLMASQFRASLAEVQQITAESSFLALLVGRSTSLGVVFGQVAVLVTGALLVLDGQLTVGALISFAGVLVNVGVSFGDLSNAIPEWLQTSGSARRIQALLGEEQELPDRPDAVAVAGLAEAIRFEHVTFTYPGGRGGLHDLSLTIPANTFVAFVGPSGSGKSTILNVLLRLREPSSGRVLLDGTPLQQVSEASLRRLMGVVSQETFLFNTSVRENIRLGLPTASEEQIEAAAAAARVRDFVQAMPQGYDTPVGEHGKLLSGGQRQRLAVARALLRDPAVLVLDEATSALDPATEAAFNETLAELGRGRTVISVTHRLSGITRADMIFVLDGGRVVEQGTHGQLVSREGAYYELWRKQSGFQFSDDGRAQITPERLGEVPLFLGVDKVDLDSLSRLFFTEEWRAGTTIYGQGEPGDKFYILVRGTAHLVQTGQDDGEDVLLETVQDGDFFGDAELLERGPRGHTARAATDCTTMALSGDHFRRLVEQAPLLRTIFQHIADVRSQRQETREAAVQGSAGWSDDAS